MGDLLKKFEYAFFSPEGRGYLTVDLVEQAGEDLI
jgi:hypothetical protein